MTVTSFKQIKEIANKIQGLYDDYEYVGIRVQESKTNGIGDYVEHQSSVWDNGEETEELLDGICAIDVDMACNLPDNGGYFGTVVYILGTNNASFGEDDGEIIMEDAEVLDII